MTRLRVERYVVNNQEQCIFISIIFGKSEIRLTEEEFNRLPKTLENLVGMLPKANMIEVTL